MVGETRRTTSGRSIAFFFALTLPVFAFGRWPGISELIVAQLPFHVRCEQSLLINTPEAFCCLFLGDPFVHHGVADLVGNTYARGTGSEDDDALAAKGRSKTRTAEIAAAWVIAPVPCISSLKVDICSRYFSRMRRPLLGEKSSH